MPPRKRARHADAAGTEKEPIFEVEAVLERREVKGRPGPEFLVRWRGYGAEKDSWELRKNLHRAKGLVKKFEAHEKKEEKKTLKQRRKVPHVHESTIFLRLLSLNLTKRVFRLLVPRKLERLPPSSVEKHLYMQDLRSTKWRLKSVQMLSKDRVLEGSTSKKKRIACTSPQKRLDSDLQPLLRGYVLWSDGILEGSRSSPPSKATGLGGTRRGVCIAQPLRTHPLWLLPPWC
jgi:hypothetical protein